MKTIRGYKELSDQTVVVINQIKTLEQEVLDLIDNVNESCEPDKRWLAIGKTDVEKGFMALVKSVTLSQ